MKQTWLSALIGEMKPQMIWREGLFAFHGLSRPIKYNRFKSSASPWMKIGIWYWLFCHCFLHHFLSWNKWLLCFIRLFLHIHHVCSGVAVWLNLAESTCMKKKSNITNWYCLCFRCQEGSAANWKKLRIKSLGYLLCLVINKIAAMFDVLFESTLFESVG